MSKKSIMLFAAIVALSVSFSSFALAKDDAEATKTIQKTSSLASKQKKLVLTEKERAELLEKAKKYGIDTTGLTDEEIFEKVLVKGNEELIAKAKKSGMDTDGLTAEQVRAKIEAKDKELPMIRAAEEKKVVLEIAQVYQVDTVGLSYEQIKAKVNEKMMPVLIEKAKELGVDYEGLNYEQLIKLVKAKEITMNTTKK